MLDTCPCLFHISAFYPILITYVRNWGLGTMGEGCWCFWRFGHVWREKLKGKRGRTDETHGLSCSKRRKRKMAQGNEEHQVLTLGLSLSTCSLLCVIPGWSHLSLSLSFSFPLNILLFHPPPSHSSLANLSPTYASRAWVCLCICVRDSKTDRECHVTHQHAITCSQLSFTIFNLKDLQF